jgi:hypothetical protein
MPRPKDETYVIDLCDEVVGLKSLRGHRFEFLVGDPDKRGRRHTLPVDAFYPTLMLVVEYHECQHSESVPFFDRKIVAPGVTRGERRRKYDLLREEVLPPRGITLIKLEYREFEHNSSKRLHRVVKDRSVIAKRLSQFCP